MVAYLRAFFLTRHNRALEIAALRQQLAVFKRKQPRPRMRKSDRLFWILLLRLWSSWLDALIVVKPETVISWHRAGFQLFGIGGRGFARRDGRASAARSAT